MNRRMISFVSVCSLIIMGIVPGKSVQAAGIIVDGDASEWANVSMQTSSDDRVEKWAVAQDEEYVYFYVQQNGGNAYGLPITDTKFDINYENKSNQIRFTYMMQQFKDAYYGDISGTKKAYAPSQEANKYEIEFAIPQRFFEEEEYTISYCGSSINSSDIIEVKNIAQPEPTEAVYNGIKIDGTFTDWDAVAKTTVENGAMRETAVVFDGDFVYIYIKEISDGSAAWSGESSNGKYTIYTDLGRHTTFKLNKDSIEGIEGARMVHSNYQYEIEIPASAVKQYKETISFGYYMQEEMLVKDVANLQNDSNTDEKKFSGITYDGTYTDWDYYPHQLIQYSTSGGVGEDAEAALYVDDTILYGHVLSTLHMNEREFQPFTIRINEQEETSINFRLVTVDRDGNIDMNAKLEGLDAGTYEFYLWDLNSGSTVGNINDVGAPVYGRMYLTVRKTADGTALSDEVEYQVDLEKLAEHFQMDASDMKMIQAQYINIGYEWISIAGTSTGAVMGISLCGLTVLAVLLYRKKKIKVA